MCEAQKPLWAKCPACGHTWAAAFLPMEITKAVALISQHSNCPKCATAGVVANQHDGVLAAANDEGEPTAPRPAGAPHRD